MTKPTLDSNWKRATIFIHDRPDEYNSVSHPVLYGVAINRNTYAGCKLFYNSLKVTGSCNRGGTASFTIVQLAGANANQVSLLDANKYVVIVVGTDLLWSGKILRVVNDIQSNYSLGSDTPKVWEVECESDIGKMKLQSVKDIGVVTGTVGEILTTLLKNKKSTDINWNGVVEPSTISNEGGSISYNILDGDLYSQFISLMTLSGFEWRTRLQTFTCVGTWDTDTFTISSGDFSPYDDDNFIGKWVLLLCDTFSDSTTNTKGVVAFGYCTDNTDTDIILGNILNADLLPTGSGEVTAMVLYGPVVDAAWDLSPPTPQQTFYANKSGGMDDSTCYDYNDKTDKKNVATRVTVKAKNIDTSTSNTGASESIYATLTASTKWDPEATMFDDCTIATQKTDGYVYSYTANATTIVLIGWDYALQVGDGFVLFAKKDDGTTGHSTTIQNISGISQQVQDDGTRTTTITTDTVGGIYTADAMKYSVFFCMKTYIADPSRLYSSYDGTQTIFFGSGSHSRRIDSSGVDARYGNYVLTDSFTDIYFPTVAVPIFPGCIAMNTTSHGGTAQEGSPLKEYGLITNTRTVDTAITRGELEMYATQALINHSFYLRRAAFTCLITDFLKPGERTGSQLYDWQVIKEGDRVTVKPDSSVDISKKYADGQPIYQWEVMSWTLDANTMSISAELGDFEENTFSLLNVKTSALNQTVT